MNKISIRPRAFALVAVGVSSLTWQVVAARGVLAALHGNELVLGLVLACWLVITALFSAVGCRVPRRWQVVLLGLVPVGIWAGLAAQQAVLPLVTARGEVVGPLAALWRAALCLLPPCGVLGACFGALSRPGEEGDDAGQTGAWAAHIYFWETAGTVVAGVAFHLWLYAVDLRWQAAVASLWPWLAGVALGAVSFRKNAPRWPWAVASLAGFWALVALSPWPSLPGDRVLEPDVKGYTEVRRVNARHGALSALRRGDQVVVRVNGHVLFSNQDHRDAARRTHLPLLAHPDPKRVLMVGGGLGGGLDRALEHPVRRLDYVEQDRAVVDLARDLARDRGDDGPPLSDPRVSLRLGDGRRLVAAASGTYDLILVGLSGPGSARLNRYYTETFFAQARAALRPGGIVAVTLAGSDTYLGDAAARLHATVRAAARSAGLGVTVLPGTTTLLLAGRDGSPDTSPRTLLSRFHKRGLDPRHIDRVAVMRAALPFARDQYNHRLSEVRPASNTDLHPAAYFQAVLLWLSRASPGAAAVLSVLAHRSEHLWPWLPAVGFALALLFGALVRGRAPWSNRAGARVGLLTVAVAGLCGMALELVLLLGCQLSRGVIYHELGALLTALMVGLALGSRLGPHLARQPAGVPLLLCAASSGLTLAVLSLGSDHPAVSLPLYLAVAALTGLSVGACYAPAAAALAAAGHPDRAPARAYAWDLLGAAAGALVATLAIPLVGLRVTAGFCLALSLGAASPLLFFKNK